ncbi:MAG TPA: hypothetical protein VFH51_15540, partial [Myxococcota bacterium]|nr:hypothetical protein [Myxococcota bacterium]
DAGAKGLEFQPPSGPLPWMNDVVRRFEAEERGRASHAAKTYLMGLPGLATGVPDVAVRMLGAMTGPNVFAGTVETTIRSAISYSVTQPMERVAEALLRDSVGLFTSTADCAREIQRRCLTGCGGGDAAWYDRGRFSVDFSDEKYFKPRGRWDLCQVRPGVIHTGPKGRAMWCDVYESNSALCQVSADAAAKVGLSHPIPTCVYHPAALSVRWLSSFSCALTAKGWGCQGHYVNSDCHAAPLEPGAPPPPHCPQAAAYERGKRSIMGDWATDLVRIGRLSQILREVYAP